MDDKDVKVDAKMETDKLIKNGEELEAMTKPQFLEHDNPGIEVLEPSDLEVVQPRQNLSHNRTWEKTSALPEPAYGNAGYPSPHDYISPQTADGTSVPDYDYRSGYQPPTPPTPAKVGLFQRDLVWGVKRQIFWAIIAIGAFFVVVAIAVGVGVGVATHKSTPTATSSSTYTATTLGPTATATTGSSAGISCPTNNLTLYMSESTDKAFLLVCGRDYSSQTGSTEDLFSSPTDTMSDCIELCAKDSKCVGAGWGLYNGQTTCWAKSFLGESNWSTGWYFAYNENTTVSSAKRGIGWKDADPWR